MKVLKARILIIVDKLSHSEIMALRFHISARAIKLRPWFYLLLDGVEVPEELRDRVVVVEREMKETEYFKILRKYLEEKLKVFEKALEKEISNNILGHYFKQVSFLLKYAKHFPGLYDRFWKIKEELERQFLLNRAKKTSEYIRLKTLVEELEEKRARSRLSDDDLDKLLEIRDQLEAKIEAWEELRDRVERLLSASYRPVENVYKYNKI